jgi:rhamnose utilization protein RhaD (predicted bifunctional aldolase and dehydrogenase)
MQQFNPAATLIENRWDESRAAGMSEPELLLLPLQPARRRQARHQLRRRQHLGQGDAPRPAHTPEVEVLWVKGSGGDLGSMVLDGFATLYLDKLNAMKGIYRGVDQRTRWSACCRTPPST